LLLRVPGLGVKAVDRLLLARRVRRLRADDLKRLHVPTRKVLPFVVLADHRPARADCRAARRRPAPAASRAVLIFGTPPCWRGWRSEIDLAGFRHEARALLARGVPPTRCSGTPEPTPGRPVRQPHRWRDTRPLRSAQGGHRVVPAAFLRAVRGGGAAQRPAALRPALSAAVAAGARAGAAHDPLDPDMLQARRWRRRCGATSTRCTPSCASARCPTASIPASRCTWPGSSRTHHIVEANAPWFARRFANMRWAILTPERCVEWDRRAAVVRARRKPRRAPPADAGEQLWLTYYQSIFNPARLKLR
jgi:hypothetical protein